MRGEEEEEEEEGRGVIKPAGCLRLEDAFREAEMLRRIVYMHWTCGGPCVTSYQAAQSILAAAPSLLRDSSVCHTL